MAGGIARPKLLQSPKSGEPSDIARGIARHAVPQLRRTWHGCGNCQNQNLCSPPTPENRVSWLGELSHKNLCCPQFRRTEWHGLPSKTAKTGLPAYSYSHQLLPVHHNAHFSVRSQTVPLAWPLTVRPSESSVPLLIHLCTCSAISVKGSITCVILLVGSIFHRCEFPLSLTSGFSGDKRCINCLKNCLRARMKAFATLS